ncbi:bacillithiol system redox-active protein YtxJ [bacterium]|nr:bacillithiol system redox-active protein YtxJ [bacterium]
MITDISNEAHFQALIDSQNVILFKHSTSCSLSADAYREVRSFAESHPEVSVCMVKVIEHRDFSNRLAEHFQIRHASPQIIVIKNGLAVQNYSHRSITQREIENSMT